MVTRTVSTIEPYVFILITILIHLKAKQKNGTSAKRRFDSFFFAVHLLMHVCNTGPVTALQKLYNVYIFLLEHEFFFIPL